MVPIRDYHLPLFPSDEYEIAWDKIPESDTSPLHFEFNVHPLHNKLNGESNSSDFMVRIQDETDMYSVVGGVANVLMESMASIKSVNKGNITVTWYSRPPIKIMEITSADPFEIARSLVNLMKKWYTNRVYCDWQMHLRSLAFVELSDLLNEIRTHPNNSRFKRLYYILRNVFRLSHGDLEMGSYYALFYFHLFYAEYAKWISKGKLEIMSTLGEGSRSIVFMARRLETNIEVHCQQIFALKICNEQNDVRNCRRMESILERITQHSNGMRNIRKNSWFPHHHYSTVRFPEYSLFSWNTESYKMFNI